MATRVRIIADTDPCNPRTEWDNLGTMYCEHRRYRLGDCGADDPRIPAYAEGDEAIESPDYPALRPDIAVALPLYLYDHSGITMSCAPFSCPWDSGQVGIIYLTRARLIKEYGADTPENRKAAEECLRAEVKVYDDFITGQVYGFVIEKTDLRRDPDWHYAKTVDSCFGFYGWDLEESGLLDALPKRYRAAARDADREYS